MIKAIGAAVLLCVFMSDASAQLQVAPWAARAFVGGALRGAGQAAGAAVVNSMINNSANANTGNSQGPQTYPQQQAPPPAPTYQSAPSQYYSAPRQYTPQYNSQRICRVVYQRQLVGRYFTHSEVVGVYRTPYGTTVQRRNHFVNQWRNTPVRICG
jgi:hypothetical protein